MYTVGIVLLTFFAGFLVVDNVNIGGGHVLNKTVENGIVVLTLK
jgi:hypothetical protein